MPRTLLEWMDGIGTAVDLSGVGLLVLIRTFLSFSLQVELEGRWPWQGKQGGS